MRLRYKISLIVVAVSLGVCLMTFQSYALWVKDMVAEQENVVEVGCFEIEYQDVEGTDIKLQNTYPVNDTKGLSGTPYTFTITNKCTIDDSYIVTLNTKNSNKIEAGSVTVGTDSAGQDITEPFDAFNMTDKVKYALSKENGEANGNTDSHKPSTGENLGEYAKKDTKNINTDTSKLPDATNIDQSIIIGSGTLKGKQDGEDKGESVTYHLYLWLDGDKDTTGKYKVGNEVMGQSFHASVHIINHATNSNDEQGDEPGGEESQLPQDVLDKVDAPDDDGNGLYTVTPTLEGWTEPELRYAGKNPNNYVRFNDELWRIIGLVNVKVDKGEGKTEIEQRLKIIRNEPLKANNKAGFSWDYGEGTYENDWTQATLMQMLNGIYYNSGSGECYQGSSTSATCDFGLDADSKGLSATARGMIDESIIWNIGGWNTNQVTPQAMYGYERGTTVYQTEPARPTEWSSSNIVEGTEYHSIGLMYPSDYGYASAGSNGGKTTRDQCINNTVLYSYDTDSDCYERDWLLTTESYEWFLSPSSSDSGIAFSVNSGGFVGNDAIVGDSGAVRPVVYLTSKVKILGGTGDLESPFELKAE